MRMTPASPIALIGLKAYFSHAQTLAWFAHLEGLVRAGRADGVSLVMLPSATALGVLAERADRCGIALGAQDVSSCPPGAFTGELPATLLREVGATVVEIGHAERRRLFGETEAVVAQKTLAAVEAGLTPFLCVGEAEAGPADRAAEEVCAQLASATSRIGAEPLLVGYEPAWAIGTERPAPSAHIAAVSARVRAWLAARAVGSRLLYGGTAGPGMYRELADDVDGLALGRRVHGPEALAQVLDEMRATLAGARETEGWLR